MLSAFLALTGLPRFLRLLAISLLLWLFRLLYAVLFVEPLAL